jgi:probable HAF family extracellular repeat protein
MALIDRTSNRCQGLTAITAGVFTALALASSEPAWGQDTGDPARDAMAPARMPMGMMGGSGGSDDTSSLTGHGFLLDKGVFTTIDHPDAVAETGASSINNRGQIVGGYVDAEGTTHGFLLDDGVFAPIDHPDAASGPGAGTVARDINKRGQIVGFYFDAEGTAHGFLRDKEGIFTPIDHPDAPQEPGAGTAAFGINDHGQIVGFHFDVGAESARGSLLEP